LGVWLLGQLPGGMKSTLAAIAASASAGVNNGCTSMLVPFPVAQAMLSMAKAVASDGKSKMMWTLQSPVVNQMLSTVPPTDAAIALVAAIRLAYPASRTAAAASGVYFEENRYFAITGFPPVVVVTTGTDRSRVLKNLGWSAGPR